jgi:hypothetical protein
MSTLIGYSVGWNDTDVTKLNGNGYFEARADATCGMEIFKKISDAEIVLAAEKLKTPSMDWEIFEVHRSKDGINGR